MMRRFGSKKESKPEPGADESAAARRSTKEAPGYESPDAPARSYRTITPAFFARKRWDDEDDEDEASIASSAKSSIRLPTFFGRRRKKESVKLPELAGPAPAPRPVARGFEPRIKRDAFGNAVAPEAAPEPDEEPPPSPTRGLATFLVPAERPPESPSQRNLKRLERSDSKKTIRDPQEMVREIKKRQKKKEKRVKKMRKRLRADLEKKNPPASPRKPPPEPKVPEDDGDFAASSRDDLSAYVTDIQAAVAAIFERDAAERALREKLEAGEIEDDAQSSSTFTSGPPDLDTYEMEQALAKPDQDVPGGFEGAGHGGALRTTDTEKSLVRTVVSTLAATLDAAESARVAEPPQRAVRKNWRMPDFDYGDPIVTATTIDALHRADPFAQPFAAPLLPVAALRLDLAVTLDAPSYAHRPAGADAVCVAATPSRRATRTYTCPCGARCDYATRDAHLVACKAFKEAWEEALRRLVEEFTAAQVRRYLSRMSQYKLVDDAAAFCALAETRGDVDEAVSRLGDDQYRRDMQLAGTLHGLKSLDKERRAPYVPGDSGSDQVTEVVRNAAFRGASRQKSREDVHFEDSDLKERRLYYVD